MKKRALVTLVAGIATLVATLWIAFTRSGSAKVAEEREIRTFLRELERDLIRSYRIEVFNHIAVNDGTTPDEGIEAVTHRLDELMKVERIRFSDVQLSVSGRKALVQLTVNGYAPDRAGHLNPYTEPLVFRLERDRSGWTITDV